MARMDPKQPPAGRKPAAPAPPLAAGDVLPRFRLPDATGEPFDVWSDAIAGNPLALVLLGSVDGDDRRHLDGWRGRAAELAACGIRTVAVTPAAPAANAGLDAGFPVLSDPGGVIAKGFRTAVPATVLVRPNQHVLAILGPQAADHAAIALDLLRPLAEAQRPVAGPAHPPVLQVLDVLSAKDCQQLISTFLFQGNEFVEPGHNVREPPHDYKMRIPEYGRQDRIDHWIVNAETQAMVTDRLRRRVFPEIQKAFQYRITRFERYRIGCYEGERGGEVHGHRDNVEPRVAHRRFACSVNLNTEAFEGGELRFPEYGPQVYRPGTGAAIVFSSSILHEAMHVTAGRRYVLLAFLFGDT